MYRAIVGILLIILAVGAAAETSPLDKIKAANEQSLKSKSAASQFEYIDAAFKYLMEERQRVWQAVGDEMVSITDFNMTYALGEGTTVTYTLKNNSDIPIGRIAIDGESKTEGRSKPWFKFELTPAIKRWVRTW